MDKPSQGETMPTTTSASPSERASNIVSVPAPATGTNTVVNMVPGSAVQLPFNPGDATVSREGNDLTFELDNGGSVTVADFFAAGENQGLPPLILPDGEEVPAEVVFADANFNLETAAGPGTGGNTQGSGAGEYTDDPGALVDGISRLGSLGTIYWERNTEVPEDHTGIEMPGGNFNLGGVSDLGGLIGLVGAVYEDGRPYQHQGDYDTFIPGQLVFTFEPTGTTVVDAIRVSGFPAGTVIYLGDPNDESTPTVTVTGPDQVLNFQEEDFANGVYFVPPKNSDEDFNLNVEVDIRAESSGMTSTISDTVTVTVDAVADRPDLGGYDATADSSSHTVSHEAEDSEYEQGFNKVENNAADGTVTGGAKVTVTVQATFDDYEDGSESHYMLVETHPHLTLDPDSLPPGYTYLGTIEVDGVTYHQFQVDNDLIADNGGTVELPVVFETTGDAGDKTGQDEQYDLKVGAYAEEDATDGEIDLGNNQANIVSQEGSDASAAVDVINRGLEVSVGWASEGNDNSKHKAGSYDPGTNGFANMDEGDGVASDSTGKNGAPINIGLTGTHDGTEEFITSVELEFDEGRGQLCVNGEPVYDGYSYSENGVTYTFAVDSDGKVTITVDGKTDNLDDLNMTFKPNPGYDDTDVNMSYKVNVENEAGASAEYGGGTEIVIDAVADRPVNISGGTDYGTHDDGSARTAAAPGDTVDLNFTIKFPDQDGSEEHRVFIRVDGNNGSATHGYDTIDTGRIAELNGLGAGLNPNGEYLELPIPHPSVFDANGEYTDPQTGLAVHYDSATGTYTYPALDITVTTGSDGTYSITGVEVTLPDYDTLTDGDKGNGELNEDTGDTSMGFGVTGWAHEQGGDKGSSSANNEHDTKNNDAFAGGNANVNIATPGAGSGDFIVGGGSGFENDQAHNNVPGTTNQDADGNDNTESGGVGISITWDFTDAKESVTEITIKVPLDRYGNPVGDIEYNGQVYTADAEGNIRIPVTEGDAKNGISGDDMTFIPKGNQSGAIDLEVTATVKDSASGETSTVNVTSDDNKLTVDLDAVANRSGEVTGDAAYGEGKDAFAPGPGDSITVTIGTTFADNDGSEQHFLLVEQKPHWNSQFATGDYDLDGDGQKTPYFKIPIPTAPKEGGGTDPDDPHQLTNEEWAQLQEDGSITVTRDGYEITIELQQNANGEYDPSLPWKVEAEVPLTPPALGEGKHSLGTGSLVEERDIDHNTENRGDEYKDNNVAMRPGEDVEFNVDYAEGIRVDTGFVYENNEQYEGPAYMDKNGNILDPGYEQSGGISVTPSSPDDSFFGDLEVSIPAGHGDLYCETEHGKVLLEPGNEYPYTTKDGVDGKLSVTEENGQLKVTFTPGDQSARYGGIDLEVCLKGDYSDKDIDVSVKGKLVNENSGHEKTDVSGGGKVMVDAVAQAPDEVASEVDGANDTAGTGTAATVTLKSTFDDVGDGSEGHYFLLEAKPGFSYTFMDADGNPQVIDVTSDWPTVLGPDGKTYFKIPANPDSVTGEAELEVDIKVTNPDVVSRNGDSGNASFNYGAMTEEEVLSDNGEKTYDNNIAFNEGNRFEVNVDTGNGSGGTWNPVDIGTAYENNTPNAHLGGEAAAEKEYPEVTLNVPDDADGIWINPGDRGSLVDENGDPFPGITGPATGPDGADGWYYVTKEQADTGGIHFKVGEDYNDADVPVQWEVDGGGRGGQSGNTNVIVDAVAQQASVDEVTYRTEPASGESEYTHAGSGDVVLDIKLSDLVDPGDVGGATTYYVLVEALPGWECEGGELVLIDGKSYFRVPIDPDDINPDGTANVQVTVKNPGGGDTEQKLAVGAMVEDRPGDSGEITMDNNTSVNINGEVAIKTSVAEPTLVLKVGEGYEDNLEGYANINVSNVGPNDEVTEMHFTVDSSEGVFVYDGQVLTDGIYPYGNVTVKVETVNGQTKVSFTPTPPATGLTEQDLADISSKFGFGTADGNHSNDDIDIDWGYTVRDTQSGDTATGGGGKTVVIDAVAHEPAVTDYEVSYGPGKEAALPGQEISVKATVEFTNIDGETNYVLVQFTPGWEVNGITITGPDGNEIHYSPEELAQMDLFYPDGTGSGGAYYKLPLEKDGVSIDPNAAEGDTYQVQVEVDVKTPQSGITGDTGGNVGIGGAAVDSYNDGETKLSNNVASDTANTDTNGDGIKIGVADSTHIEGEQTGGTPEEGADNVIIFDIRPEGGENDVITGLTLNNPNPGAGDFYYDGVKLEYDEHGNVILPPEDAGEDWVFDTGKLEFHPNDTFGGDLNIKIDASVKDAASGDAKDGLKGEVVVSVDPVATAPTAVEAESKFSDDGGVWTLTVSAVFADIDGSEDHFFMFKVPEGLNLAGQYDGLEGPMTGPDGTDGWYKLPVDSTEANPAVDLNFTADSTYDGTSGVEYQAGATEAGDTAWADMPGSGEASPSDDGGFVYRTETVSGAADFSGVTENLHIQGSNGDDTITGGEGDDIIDGGAGDDVIHANAGDNIIIGGAGDDLLYGGDGQDTFLWDLSHFGQGQAAIDTILDFEYGKDLLAFSDVFDQQLSEQNILDLLDNGNGEFTNGTLSLDVGGVSLMAEFSANGVILNISSDGAEQIINVSFDSAHAAPGSEAEAAAFLSNLISQGMA